MAGLRLTGLMATKVLDGPINREAFQAYVEQLLVRKLKPGGIVIMDSCPAKGPAIEAVAASPRSICPSNHS